MELPIRYLNEKGQLDDGETSQMRYVYDIMYGEGEPYHNADWTVVIYPSKVKLVDIPSAAEIFAERYNTGQIICPYKYESYITTRHKRFKSQIEFEDKQRKDRNKKLQDNITYLRMDKERL